MMNGKSSAWKKGTVWNQYFEVLPASDSLMTFTTYQSFTSKISMSATWITRLPSENSQAETIYSFVSRIEFFE